MGSSTIVRFSLLHRASYRSDLQHVCTCIDGVKNMEHDIFTLYRR